MRKFTLIAALAFSVMGINAQELNFVREGEVVKDGATLEVKSMKETNPGFGKFDAELLVQNAGTEDQEATLTISVLDGSDIAFCGFGNGKETTCLMVSKEEPQTRKRTMKAGETNDPEVHTLAPLKMNDSSVKFYSKVEYKLTYGSTTKTVIVDFNYGDAASMSTVYGESNVYVADNALQYSFGNAANRSLNIYSITGALVKSEVLENAGTVSLNNLNKGVYLYEIMQNGKRIAAHKCVIR